MIYKILYKKENGQILTYLNEYQSLDLLLENYPVNSVNTLDIEFNGSTQELFTMKVDISTMQLVSIFL